MNSSTRRQIVAMRDRKEGNAVKLHPLDARLGVEDHVEEQVAALVSNQPDHKTTHEPTDCSSPIHISWGIRRLS